MACARSGIRCPDEIGGHVGAVRSGVAALQNSYTIDTVMRHARGDWQSSGRERPPFAVAPAAGQESVWDYPRPPHLGPDSREVIVRVGDTVIGQSARCLRVLETASPPTIYMPPDDIAMELLEPAPGRSRCEWKGGAQYWTVVVAGLRIERAAWSYADPFPEFALLRDYVSFYPGRVECSVDGSRAAAQPGGFYGGWITSEIVGPFKGEPGTEGW